jgi:hypothetical protein
LTCIKSYPLDDAMVTRLIKSMAVTEIVAIELDKVEGAEHRGMVVVALTD